MREVILTQNDIASIENRPADVFFKFRKKMLMPGCKMVFKFKLLKLTLTQWYQQYTSNNLGSRLLGAGQNEDDVDNEVLVTSADMMGGIQEDTTSIQFKFRAVAFTETINGIISFIIKKQSIKDWYLLYVEGGGPTDYVLTVSPSSFNIDSNSTSKTISVTANVDWEASVPSDAAWLTINPTSWYTDRDVQVVVQANSSGSTRNTTITFKAPSVPSLTKTVSISQQSGSGSEYYLNVSESTLNINSSQQSRVITVTANVDWNVSVSDTMPVAHTLSVSPTSISHTYTAGTETITVNSSDAWTATSSETWCTIPASGSSSTTIVTINFSENGTTSRRDAIITIQTNYKTATVSVYQEAQQQPSGESYSVGLISDIHYCVTANKKVITESPGNDPGDYGSDSFFREDLHKLIIEFKNSGVEFVASCGDIVTSDVNDLIEFTHDYIKNWTGLDVYSGTSFWNNSSFKPFYCAIGNHDHWTVYSDADHCKYINYGNSVDHNGSRWEVINYNGTSYNCPELLASMTSGISYASSSSKSYYITPSGHPNDMFIFLSAFYGARLPDASNPNYTPSNKNDLSQMHPHNQLDPNDQDVIDMMSYCGKTSIFTSGNETHMNFQYYKPSDLMWLKNTIQANSSKRIFVFSHYFFPQKAGGGNKYECGSTELYGLTFHFLNKLNNDFPRTIWFSGHSHYSWKDLTYNNTGDIHFCNKDYQYIEPDATDNAQILSNFTGSNYYAAPSGRKLYNRADSQTVTDNATGWNVHLPSMSRPKESSSIMANCEAAIMTVYDDKVEISKIGYSTSDGNNYTSYTGSIYYRTLTVQKSDGSGTISGPTPGGGGGPTAGILTDNCFEISINNTGSAGKYNSHIRFEFEDGGYLHVYCGGAAEQGNATYAGKYSPKYSFSGGYGWSNLLTFIGDSIPAKFRYLAYHWGLAIVWPADGSTAWITRSEFFSEGSKEKRAYYGSETGDPNDNPHWIEGSDKTEFVNIQKSTLSNYQCKKLKSSVRVYYYDSNYNEQYVTGTLTDVCYHSSAGDGESLGLYFVNGLSDDVYVRYKITF